MTLKQKAKELNKIDRKIIRIMKESLAECKKPPAKRMATALKRCVKIVRIAIQTRMLEMQKRIIISQPTPKLPKGSDQTGGPAMVGERGEEIVTSKCHFIEPGYQNGDILPRQHDNITHL